MAAVKSAELRVPRVLTRLREALVENIALKLVSLIISLMLFGVVRGAGNVQRSLDVPVTFVLPTPDPGHRVLLSTLPEKVRVTLRGSPSVLTSLRADELGAIQLDLRDGNARNVRLQSSLIVIPAGTSFVSLTPDVIPLQWDVIAERTTPVRATVVGSLPPRAHVDHVEVEPANVRVRGASLYVDPLVTVHTEPIDASGLAVGRYERRIPLEPPRSGVEYETVQGVRVSFEIVQPVYERRFEHVPVVVLGAVRAQLRPPQVAVVVRGDPAVVDHLQPSDVVPFVDLASLVPLRTPTPVRVEVRPLPDGCAATATAPDEVLAVPLR